MSPTPTRGVASSGKEYGVADDIYKERRKKRWLAP